MVLTPLPTLLSIINQRKMFPSSRLVMKDPHHLIPSLPRHLQMIVRRSQDLPSYSICGNPNPQSKLGQDVCLCILLNPLQPTSLSLTPARPLAHKLCLSVR